MKAKIIQFAAKEKRSLNVLRPLFIYFSSFCHQALFTLIPYYFDFKIFNVLDLLPGIPWMVM
jgi:hypothetical protein